MRSNRRRSRAQRACAFLATATTLAGIQAARAQDTAPPRIIDVDPSPDGGVVDQRGLMSVDIVFDETVTIPIGAVTAWTVSRGPIARVGTSFDIPTNTLTISFDEPLAADRLTLVLDYAIADLAGNPLDGEIADPANASFPSGNGQPGGQAVFRLDVLQGDVNRDGIVDDADVSQLLQAMGQCEDDEGYDAQADLNLDGCINVLDVNILQGGFGGALPETDGVAPTIVARMPDVGAVIRAFTFDTVTTGLSEPIDEAVVAPTSLFSLQPDGTVRAADIVDVSGEGEFLTFTFAPPLDQLGVHAVQLSNAVADSSGELLDSGTLRTWDVDLDYSPATVIASSPADGEQDVALTRESIITFDFPLDPRSVTASSVFATFANEPLAAMIHLSPDVRKVTLFYEDNLPPSAIVRVHVVGDLLVDDLGNTVDADGDGEPGGTRFIDFDTITLTTLPGTKVCGRVFASELATSESSGEPINLPLEGVVITVDGAEDELFAVTDDKGNFCLDPAPVGSFFVHIDGATATNVDTPEGAYYPFVGKSWTSIAGQETNLGDVFLPLIVDGTLQEVSDVEDVTVTFPDEVIQKNPELAGVEVMVPAGSLFADDGTTGGFVGIAPVDPDRLPGELPEGLDFPLVITVQTDAMDEGGQQPTNFDVPVPVLFPNLPHPETGKILEPGAKSALWSFDHDTGSWGVIGPMTVSEDGQLVVTDPGIGIIAPGWHGTQPGNQGDGDGGGCGACCLPFTDYNIGPAGKCGIAVVQCILMEIVTVVKCGACLAAPKLALPCILCVKALTADKVFCLINIAKCSECLDQSGLADEEMELLAAVDLVEQARPIMNQMHDLGLAVEASGGDWGKEDLAQLDTLLGELDDLAGGDFVGLAESFLESLEPSYAMPDNLAEVAAPAKYGILLPDGPELRGDTGSNGGYSVLVGSDQADFTAAFYEPVSGTVGIANTKPTDAVGQTLSIPPFVLSEMINPDDQDRDGLADFVERVYGTNLFSPDTDADGIDDGAEVDQGTDPLDGLIVQTGIIATADTPGTAKDICAVNDLAIVADGSTGISVFNVFNGMDPTIVAQVETPGFARAVACAGPANRVAVADDDAGLAIIDITDPPAASVVHQVSAVQLGGGARAVEAAAGVAYVGSSLGQVSAVDLGSGAVLSTTQVGAAIRDLVLDGEVLYGTTNSLVFAIPLGPDEFEVAGTAPHSGVIFDETGRLFVGGGVAYATKFDGYNTYDLSDPLQPTLISNAGNPQNGWRHLVGNGSGLGIATVGVANPNASANVDLYDISDPAVTNAFLTTFETPGSAKAVSIYNGLAYVADGDSGLQVLNYLAYDSLGTPPEVSFAIDIEGSQVQEGSLVLVTASVSDDVQVRNVELLVNDEPVQIDGNFPFQFFLTVPFLPDGATDRGPAETSFDVAVAASDTGGNTTTTDPMTFEIVPDIFPPTVTSSAPLQDEELPSGLFDGAGANIRVSEPLDPATVGERTVLLTWAGPDGDLDTPDDELVDIDVSLVDLDRRIIVDVDGAPFGDHRLVFSGAITDNAGNGLDGNADGEGGDDFVVEFNVFESDFTKFWIADSGGDWNEPLNWSDEELPQPSDLVLIDRPADLQVTVSSGSPTCGQLLCDESLVLTGGTLTVVGTVQVNGAFTINGGTISDATILADAGTLVFTSSTNNRLTNVIIDGDITLSGNNAVTRISQGLTLNGTIHLAGSNSRLLVENDLTIGSDTTGVVAFEGTGGSNRQITTIGANILTIAPEVSITGGRASIGNAEIQGGQLTLINNGEIIANASGQTITISSNAPLTNNGTLAADNAALNIDALQGDLGMASAVNGATLDLAGDWTNSKVLDVTDSTLTLGGTWVNDGTINTTNSTANLGGTFTLTGLGDFNRDGGTVNLTGTLDNDGKTLVLDADTGNWTLNGGTITGGIIQTSRDGTLVFTSSTNNRLTNVIIDGDITLSGNNAVTRISQGLTLNGTIHLTGSNSRLLVENDLTIGSDATGVVAFEGTGGSNRQITTIGANILTIAPEVSITGGRASIGNAEIQGGQLTLINNGEIIANASGQTITISSNAPLTNNGTLAADNAALNIDALQGDLGMASAVNGATLDLAGDWTNSKVLDVTDSTLTLGGTWVNDGTINTTNSTANLGGTFTLTGLGDFNRDGGTVNLTGTLDNDGKTLVLDADTGNWTLNGGTITGGIIQTSRDGTLVFTSSTNNRLTNVIIDGDITLSGNNAVTRISQGLTLNGTIHLTGSNSRLLVENDLTIGSDATGVVAFEGTGGSNRQITTIGANILTIAPEVSITGGRASIGNAEIQGGQLTLINNGEIIANASGQTITISSNAPLTNNGTLAADNAALNIDALQGDLGMASAVNGATLDLAGDWTNSKVLDVTDSTLTLGGTWVNDGTINTTNSTANLGGTFTLTGLGDFNRDGGTVNLTGTLDNDGKTLVLDADTGNWTLNGGTITGGIIQTSRDGTLVFTSSTNNRLTNVIIDGDITLSGNNAVTRISQGLTLNGTIHLTGSNSRLLVENDLTIGSDATGVVAFEGTGGSNRQITTIGANILTIAPEVSITGGRASIGNAEIQGGQLTLINNGEIIANASGQTITISSNAPLTNNGTLAADNAALNIDALQGDLGMASAVNGATLDLAGDWTNSKVLDVTDSTLTLGGTWVNDGTINTTNSTANLGGTFTLTGLGDFNRDGGTVNLTGTLDNDGKTLVLDADTGNWTLNGGTITGGIIQTSRDGTLVFTSSTNNRLTNVIIDGDITLSGNNAVTRISQGLTLNGTIHLTGSNSRLLVENDLTIGSDATGVVAFEGTGGSNRQITTIGANILTIAPEVSITGGRASIGNAEIQGGQLTLINNGEIIADASGQTITISSNAPLTNNGTLAADNAALNIDALQGDLGMASAVNGATLDLAGDWTNSKVLDVTDSTLTLGGTWVNDGTINTTNSTANLGGTFTLTGLGDFNRDGGTVNLTGTLDNDGKTLVLDADTGNWTLNGGTITGGIIQTSRDGTLVFTSSTNNRLTNVIIDGDITLSGNNAVTRISQGLTLNGTIHLTGSNSRLLVENDLTIGSDATGVVAFEGTGGSNRQITTIGANILTIAPEVSITGGRASIGNAEIQGGQLTLINNGEIIANASGQTITISSNAPLTNNGTLAADNATLNISSSWSNDGGLLASSGGVISCSALTQSSLGSCTVEIAGTSTTQYGRITCSGTATLDGTLVVQFVDGFVPVLDDFFDVLTYGSHTGAFGFASPDIPGGLVLEPAYLESLLRLTTIEGP